MAAGDTLAVFTPLNAIGSLTTATPDTRNSQLCLDFDPTTDEEAVFRCVIPSHYTASAAFDIIIGWAATDTTVGPDNAVWQAAFLVIGNDTDDIDTAAFGSFTGSGAVAEASASGELSYDQIDVTFANAGSPLEGETVLLKIRRDADDTSATDSLGGDAELYFVELREST